MANKTKIKESKKTEAAFFEALRKFKKEFPMVYIETWTPSDFTTDDEGNESDEVDWNDPDMVCIAEALEDQFDANEGTNWEVIRRVRGEGY